MSKMSKFLIIGFLLFFVLDLCFAQEMCTRCRQRERSACELSCDSLRNAKERPRCTEKCLTDNCAEDCGGAASKPVQTTPYVPQGGFYGSNHPPNSCQGCIERARYGECQSMCQDSRDPARCANRCAKSRCAKACPLPTMDREEKTPRENRRERCALCERQSGADCRKDCGLDKSAVGYVTCEVACIKRKCRRICGPES